MKKIILGIIFVGVLYVGYNYGIRLYLNRYNNTQWNEYVSYWNQVKVQAQPLIQCKNILSNSLNALESKYVDALDTNDSIKTKEQKYYENMYKILRGVTEGLNSELSYYEQSTPEIQGGLFFYTNSPYEPVTPWYIQNRRQKTVETLNYYKDRLLNYEMNKIKELSCPNITDKDIVYPMNKGLCTELMNYYISRSTPPSRDNFDLDIEYKKALEAFNEEVKNKLDYCDRSGSLEDFSSFYFNEIHW